MTDSAVPWRRLDQRMLAIRPVQALMRAAIPLGALLLYGRGSAQEWMALAGAVVVVLAGVAHWFTTRYRIGPTQVELVTGLLRRRRLSVPLDRIRGVDVTATPLHRLLGVAVVKIGTGRQERSREDELALDAVSAAEAVRLRSELLHRRDVATGGPEDTVDETAAPETALARLDLAWLRYAPFTLSGLVTVAAIVGFAGNFLNDARVGVGPVESLVERVGNAPLVAVVVAAAVALLAVTTVLSVVGYLVSYWNFTLTRHPGGTLHVTRGLLTTRAVSLEERRLRGVEVVEPVLLRAVGAAQLSAIATGSVGGGGGGAQLLLPPAPAAEAHRVATEVLRAPGVATAPLQQHGPAARRRRYIRALAPVAVLIAALAGLQLFAGWPGWPWRVALLLIPAALLLASDRYRNLGHALAGRFLVGRSGSAVRRTFALQRDGIIGWRLDRTFFQRRAGLMSVTATTAGGASAYTVPDVPESTGIRLADEALPALLTPFLVRNSPPVGPTRTGP
jgi:putative membrane protein